MPKIVISKDAFAAVHGASTLPWKDDDVRELPSGEMEVELRQVTIDRVKRFMMEGETLSETILRMAAHMKGSVH